MDRVHIHRPLRASFQHTKTNERIEHPDDEIDGGKVDLGKTRCRRLVERIREHHALEQFIRVRATRFRRP